MFLFRSVLQFHKIEVSITPGCHSRMFLHKSSELVAPSCFWRGSRDLEDLDSRLKIAGMTMMGFARLPLFVVASQVMAVAGIQKKSLDARLRGHDS
jgi:hypothetical protein